MKIRATATLLALVLGVAACADLTRPSIGDWSAQWVSAVAGIPSRSELGDPPSRQLCDDAVGFLRSAEEELIPTPDAAIDGVVEEWLAVSKDAFFECPPTSPAVPDFASAYAELARLQAEVEVVLEMDR
ncbi:MAG: hypothetical protein OEM66_02770 [Acidimicrobiia bacterium]|nr:hypothetical protein [Acidimicrobiia bacterium]